MDGQRAALFALPRLTGVLLTTLPPQLRDVFVRTGTVQLALGLLDAANLSLSFALQWRAYLDQQASAPFSPSSLAVRLLDIDRRNTRFLREIVASRGWPGISVVGRHGARAAWLLVQHADRDPTVQQDCLPLLAAAVAAGDAEPRHLAYLVDRVRVAEGKRQVYGTQYGVGGEPRPIEQPEQVDERRAAVGLEPLGANVARIQQARSRQRRTAA